MEGAKKNGTGWKVQTKNSDGTQHGRIGGKENQTGTDADMEKRIQNVDGN
jgi:hypothetical protein